MSRARKGADGNKEGSGGGGKGGQGAARHRKMKHACLNGIHNICSHVNRSIRCQTDSANEH